MRSVSKSRTLLALWLAIVLIALCLVGIWVYRLDPYFHYHAPDTDRYFYTLTNQRSQNNGIIRRFKYDAMITGTSLTENFRTSEMDELFGTNAVKLPFAGATFREIDENIRLVLESNPEMKTVVRSLEMQRFYDDKDAKRDDLGDYPTYLYDRDPFNDVEYLFNRDVVFGMAYQMSHGRNEDGFEPGITSFDDYSTWRYAHDYGVSKVCPEGIVYQPDSLVPSLTDSEKDAIRANIAQNVTKIADDYPNVEFYCFIAPYSAAWWSYLSNDGTVLRHIEAEQCVIEEILGHRNIYLFSFNDCPEITADLNNYKDTVHYGTWINSLILKWMRDGEHLLTEENYLDYLQRERDFYTSFDYSTMNTQEDYEYSFYAAALLNEEVTGSKPVDLLGSGADMSGCVVSDNGGYGGGRSVVCSGRLQREPETVDIADYLVDTGYIGVKADIDLSDGHSYLTFCGKRISGDGQPTVCVYDRNGVKVAGLALQSEGLDYEWHRYVIDLYALDGDYTVILNGGAVDCSKKSESTYVFSDIILY